eukprot:Hpha_TRINITY_DN16901_c1_g1::TRINITY_DN16901_c1_g1_i3::g.52908::m.52908
MCCWDWMKRVAERSVRVEDTAQEARIKLTLIPVVFILGIWQFIGLFISINQGDSYMFTASLAIPVLHYPVFLLWAIFCNSSIIPVLDVCLYLGVLSIMMTHFSSISFGATGILSHAVITLDVALLFERDNIPKNVIPIMLIYVVFERCEAVFDWGLYEIGMEGWEGIPPLCDCPAPPCPLPWSVLFNGVLGFGLLLIVDFHLTRGFSKGMRKQLARVEAAVNVAGEVTAALARYDVDAADKVISGESDLAGLEDLPPELAESFH